MVWCLGFFVLWVEVYASVLMWCVALKIFLSACVGDSL